MNKFFGTLVFASLIASQLGASTVSAQFTGANGQTDSSGNYISPYTATVNGVSTTIYCDDFANHVSNGQQWTANITNLASSDLSNTRYSTISNTLSTSATTSSNFSGKQLYEMAAYLTTQFAASGTAGYASNGDIQDTLWDLFNPNSQNTGVTPPKPSSNQWLYAAEKNYSSINLASFNILTNTSAAFSGAGQTQGVHRPHARTVIGTVTRPRFDRNRDGWKTRSSEIEDLGCYKVRKNSKSTFPPEISTPTVPIPGGSFPASKAATPTAPLGSTSNFILSNRNRIAFADLLFSYQ